MLADANPNDLTINRRALGEAIGAGNMALAVRLARKLPRKERSVDARLLLIADDLLRGRSDLAIGMLEGPLDTGSLSFLAPLLTSWNSAERGDPASAVATLSNIPPTALLTPVRDENIAYILLKFRQAAEAEPFARRAIGNAGIRETRVRLALADSFLAAGDRARASAMVQGIASETGAAKQRIEAGKRNGLGIDNGAKAFGELLTGMAADLSRMENRALPVGMAQVARYANPQSSMTAVVLASILVREDRAADALAILAQVPANDPLGSQASDSKVRILIDEKRFDEALRAAQGPIAGGNPTAGDYSRLGDVLAGMKRYDNAAQAYAQALALAHARGQKDELWTLHLLRATALEDAGRWPEAKQALHAGLALAPEQPLILNFLGYSMLERGEELNVAEAMIRKASALAPDEASITDSLGWALYKRGRLPEAIETLQRAAAKDPEQYEIHEHLGDALYASGRRYEARFAWQAALVSAAEDVVARIRSKIDSGLTPATAAP